MNNKNLEKIKKYVTEHYGNKASFLLRKTSLLRGLANVMGCHAYMTNNNHREGYFLISLVKDFDFGNVSLKDVVIWQSSEFKPYGKVLDEFLNAFRCKNAHFTNLEFNGNNGSCDIKLDVPYYETDDELQMQCVLAGTWVDIEAA